MDAAEYKRDRRCTTPTACRQHVPSTRNLAHVRLDGNMRGALLSLRHMFCPSSEQHLINGTAWRPTVTVMLTEVRAAAPGLSRSA